MARAIARGAANAGIVVKVFKMGATPNSTVAAELFTASGFLAGSSTLNCSMQPNMGSLLIYLKGLGAKGKRLLPSVPSAGQAVRRRIWRSCWQKAALMQWSLALTANGLRSRPKLKLQKSMVMNLR